MFVTWSRRPDHHRHLHRPSGPRLHRQLAIWLWFTVSSQLRRSMAKAAARPSQTSATPALIPSRRVKNGSTDEVNASELRKGDIVAIRTGE